VALSIGHQSVRSMPRRFAAAGLCGKALAILIQRFWNPATSRMREASSLRSWSWLRIVVRVGLAKGGAGVVEEVLPVNEGDRALLERSPPIATGSKASDGFGMACGCAYRFLETSSGRRGDLL
jgi:hypothetical protein